MEAYTRTRNESVQVGETNDCSVVAFSIAFEISYKTSHAMHAKYGRKPRCGTSYKTHVLCVNEMELQGYTTEEIIPRKVYERYGKVIQGKYSLKSIGAAYPEGRYLVKVRGHILAMVDGVIEDWSEGRKLQVKTIIKVEL